MRCKICFDKLDTDAPWAVRGLNPITLKIAWMHMDCYKEAYQDLSPDQKDRYNQKD